MELLDAHIEQLLKSAEQRLTKHDSLEDITEQTVDNTSLDPSNTVDGEKKSSEKSTTTLIPRVIQSATIKSKKSEKTDAGPQWYNLPRTNLTPELQRDLQLLQLRGAIDPKAFYKKRQTRHNVPQYSHVGTVVEGPTEFFSSRLTRKKRKQTFADELLSNDALMRKYSEQYQGIQKEKNNGRQGHYKRVVAARQKR